MMVLLWVTLLLLHRGYTLAPVTTVHLGLPVTLTCPVDEEVKTSTEMYWYKQSIGESLKLIAKLYKKGKPTYSSGEASASRLNMVFNGKSISLTIYRTVPEDEGMYHCAIIDWLKNTWSGTYLFLKGNHLRMSNYTVVQTPPAFDSDHPGDSKTLQCSVLSDSENQTCSDFSVFWVRAASNKLDPHIIYSNGSRADKCNQKADTQRKCVHHFSKSIISSEVGTYYCAVATCGEILFGNGTKVETVESEFTALMVALICLGFSVIVNIALISCCTKAACGKGPKNNSSQKRDDNRSKPRDETTEGEQDLNYAALPFSEGRGRKTKRNKIVNSEESVYSQVKISTRPCVSSVLLEAPHF